jgi:transcriptional regulator with XRE-family HTH domain
MSFQEKFEKAQWNVKMEALRMLSGFTRNEFADRIGTGRWLYNQWANGKHYPIPINRKAICKALGVSEDLIFG